MADIAELGYSIPTEPIDVATEALDRHAEAAKKVGQTAAVANAEVATSANTAAVAERQLGVETEKASAQFGRANLNARRLVEEMINMQRAGAGAAAVASSIGSSIAALGIGLVAGVAFGLVLEGFRKITTAASDYYAENFTSGPTVERSMKSQVDALAALKNLWGETSTAAEGYFQTTSRGEIQRQSVNLASQQDAIEKTRQDIESQLSADILTLYRESGGALAAGARSIFGFDESDYAKFSDRLAKLDIQFRTDQITLTQFRDEMSRLSATAPNEELRKMADAYIALEDAMAKAEARARTAKDAVQRVVGPGEFVEREIEGRTAAGGRMRPPSPEDLYSAQKIAQGSALRREAAELTLFLQPLKLYADQILAVAKSENVWADVIRKRDADLELSASTLGKSASETARFREEQVLLNAAIQSGVPMTQTIIDQIKQYGEAAAKSELDAERMQEQIQSFDDLRETTHGFLSTFVNDLAQGKNAATALKDALTGLGQKLLDLGENMVIDSLFGKQGTGLGGLIGQLFAPAAAPAILPALERAATTVIPAVPPAVAGAAPSAGSFLGVLPPPFGVLGSLLPKLIPPTAVPSAASKVEGSGGVIPGSAAGLADSAGAFTGIQGQVYSFFAAKGLSPTQIAGIMGNVSVESRFDPSAHGPSGDYGLFQDVGPRKTGLFSQYGSTPSAQQQLNYAWSELQGPEAATLARLRASTTVPEATRSFFGFERPSGFGYENATQHGSWDARLKAAQEAYAKSLEGVASTQATVATKFVPAVTNIAETAQQSAANFAPTFPSALSSILSAVSGGAGGIGGVFNSLFGSVSGGLFGGGRAAGGEVEPGREYDVGEEGPERLVMGSRGGMVIPYPGQRKMPSSVFSGASETFSPVIHMGHTYLTVEGSVDAKTLEMLDRRIERNNTEQHHKLVRQIGEIHRTNLKRVS